MWELWSQGVERPLPPRTTLARFGHTEGKALVWGGWWPCEPGHKLRGKVTVFLHTLETASLALNWTDPGLYSLISYVCCYPGGCESSSRLFLILPTRVVSFTLSPHGTVDVAQVWDLPATVSMDEGHLLKSLLLLQNLLGTEFFMLDFSFRNDQYRQLIWGFHSQVACRLR